MTITRHLVCDTQYLVSVVSRCPNPGNRADPEAQKSIANRVRFPQRQPLRYLKSQIVRCDNIAQPVVFNIQKGVNLLFTSAGVVWLFSS